MRNSVGTQKRSLSAAARGPQTRFRRAHFSLGYALQNQGEFTEAICSYRQALQHKPGYAEAHNNLGVALRDQGQIAEALPCFQQALDCKPDHTAAQSNLVFTLQYRSGVTLGELAAAHREYEREHAAPLRSGRRTHDNSRSADRRLRLGFLSPDFHCHPVGYFLIRVLENLDREQCEPICYSDGRTRDGLTARFQAAAAIWRDAGHSSDEQLADQIREDRIDVLFDLSGHTAHNRLLVFARKPAPIQVTWIGYEGTTGLAAMDYLLADQHVVPAGAEAHYQEKVLRMPDGYVCYDPPAMAPSVNPLPAYEKDYVTFGSFNNLAKINPEVVALWARPPPGPRIALAMKYKGLQDQTAKSRYLELFAASGVKPDRLDLLPPTPFAEYLAAYQQVDIGLDPFPFSGGAHHLRITVDGRARDHLSGRDLRQPALPEPSGKCWADGDGRPGSRGIRGIGRDARRRLAPPFGPPLAAPHSSGRLAAL